MLIPGSFCVRKRLEEVLPCLSTTQAGLIDLLIPRAYEEGISKNYGKTMSEIRKITESSLVKVTLNPEWSFVPGAPEPDWQNRFESGIPFRMEDELFDLDALTQPPSPVLSDAVVYNRFHADRAGIAQLGVGCDWWCEVFVNGQACVSTFPDGNGTGAYSPENNPFFLPVKKGENLLAIHVRRGTAGWTFSFGRVRFRMPDIPEIQYGPWLGNPDSGKMSIRFVTCGDVASGVEYRECGTEQWQLQWDHIHGQLKRRPFHVIHLSGLKEGAQYEYRIVMLDPRDPERRRYADAGHVYKFRVPDSGRKEFSFFYTADLQFLPEEQMRILENLLRAADAESCDFIVLGGDIGNEFSPSALFSGVISKLCEKEGSGRPVVMVRGNHELRGKEADRFLDYFGNSEGLSYGIFRFGDVAFLVLDSWEDKPSGTPGEKYCKYNLDEVFVKEEKEFLDEAFLSDEWISARRRIVLAHGAPYSHFDSWPSIQATLLTLTDSYFAGEKPKFHLNLWLAGHTHRYSRSVPGTDVIVAPPGSKKPNRGGRNYRYPVLTVAGPNKAQTLQASAFRIDVKSEKIVVRAFSPDGECFDVVEIENNGTITEIKSLLSPQKWQHSSPDGRASRQRGSQTP